MLYKESDSCRAAKKTESVAQGAQAHLQRIHALSRVRARWYMSKWNVTARFWEERRKVYTLSLLFCVIQLRSYCRMCSVNSVQLQEIDAMQLLLLLS